MRLSSFSLIRGRPSVLPASTARFSPAFMGWRQGTRSSSKAIIASSISPPRAAGFICVATCRHVSRSRRSAVAYVGERGQGHDGRDFQRPGWPFPVRTGQGMPRGANDRVCHRVLNLILQGTNDPGLSGVSLRTDRQFFAGSRWGKLFDGLRYCGALPTLRRLPNR